MKILVDDQLTGRLRSVHEAVELRDASGRTYGYFHPVASDAEQPPEGIQSPFNDAELSRRRQVPGGRPLAEIWEDLAAR